ncbi:MAG: phosphoglycerate dehydrogenase [Candidatus Omnitrophica bacterium]|nr:phosphoglycerate dehydrogenase [Candidatus Omnitrophota bacterium]
MAAAEKKRKILICDPLDEAGRKILESVKGFVLVEAIKASVPELKRQIRDAEAVVVRSGTKLTGEIIREGKCLKIIGRAGVGIDNVDLEAASKKGVVVANTPSGNTISAAEHTLSLLLGMARNIAPAHQSMCQGQWERKKFTGVELFEKTLGLIGLGRIGTEVARRAQSFSMRVLAYDPFLRAEKAAELGVTLAKLDDIYTQSDFISLHVPKTPETRRMIGADAVRKMKKGVRIVNCARGGLLDEDVVLKGLESRKIAGLALDVYEEEPPAPSPLLDHPSVLKTPHLGASTEEAQLKVSIDIARTVADYLQGKGLRNAVNVQSVEPEILKEMESSIDLAEKIGKVAAALVSGQFLKADVCLAGKIAEYPTSPITAALLKGLLGAILAEDVNVVNAVFLARERGLEVTVSQTEALGNYSNLIQLKLKTAKGEHSVSGTLYNRQDPRIVAVDDLRVESVAKGHLLAVENRDVPGMVGYVGTLLGKSKVNIADMSVGRDRQKKRARIFINVDAPVSEAILRKIRTNKNILDARMICFGA